ncbi:N-acetyltransferase [Helicobacter apodemus]|uniref:N-acetyltransferase n=1 Tax=Helicobacter apodemus TaxID=135569 RepID=A0A4U8UFQ5_9HELI|nr:GNAT family N-acetyltransferase [Helicobacter apodemus]MDE6958068.1 GNAT family N-acetyltransferase [Helicobacter apodemus]TLE16706.1 N-acetyltransferase [Helicobacter apodemus]
MNTYSFPLLGKHIALRLVQLSDAAFIYALRNDKKARFLTQIIGGVQAQEQWIVEYKKREALGQEFYFIIQGGESLGTIRIYDLKEDSFCWGSWIIKDSSPSYVAIESALCIYEFAFNTLGFRQSHFDVRKNNVKVVAFHQRCKARIVREDSKNYYFNFSKEDFASMQRHYAKYCYCNIIS